QTVRILQSEDSSLPTRLRHIDIHQHWLRQEVQNGQIAVEWVATANMPADGLTKILPIQKHRNFMKMLNLHEFIDKEDPYTSA
ncbi:reverse transcriptase, partial [Aspergillus affinis]|uniref:reverse transcriptase n=1 Tax=Aspergillus affinis TaxID=1070780 RepID=UPI0022FECDF8